MTKIYKEDYEQIIQQAENEIKQHEIGIQIGRAIVKEMQEKLKTADPKPLLTKVPDDLDPALAQ